MTKYAQLSPEAKLMYAIFGERSLEPDDDDFHHEVDGKSLRDTLIGLLDELEAGTPKTRHLEVYRGRVKRVVMLRWGFVDGRPRSYQQLGEEYGLSGAAIRMNVERALHYLRRRSFSRRLKPFYKT